MIQPTTFEKLDMLALATSCWSDNIAETSEEYRAFAVYQLKIQNSSLLSFTLQDESDIYDVPSIVSRFDECCKSEHNSITSKGCSDALNDMILVVGTICSHIIVTIGTTAMIISSAFVCCHHRYPHRHH